jgi:hypothetical protein
VACSEAFKTDQVAHSPHSYAQLCVQLYTQLCVYKDGRTMFIAVTGRSHLATRVFSRSLTLGTRRHRGP